MLGGDMGRSGDRKRREIPSDGFSFSLRNEVRWLAHSEGRRAVRGVRRGERVGYVGLREWERVSLKNTVGC